MLRRRYLLFGLLALGVLSGAATIGVTILRQSRGPLREDRTEAARKAHYDNARDLPDPTLVAGNGVVEPRSPESRMAADTAGRISAIFVKEGDAVTKGTILAEIENAMQRAQISRAEADVAASQAELLRILQGSHAQDIVADATAARARAALAESELARTKELVGNGSLASAELDHARRKFEAESASSRAATERAGGAQVGARQDVSVAQAHLKGATASLEESRAALQRTQLVAPIDARVLRVKLHVGEFHNPMGGEPIVILGDLSQLRVRMDVDERDVARLKRGAAAYVTATAFGKDRFPGKVVEVGQRMGRRTVRVDDPADRIDVKILEASIELDGMPPLVPGMRVSAFVDTKK